VQVLGARRRQHFTPGLVEGGQGEGWLSVQGDRLTIHGTTVSNGRERITPVVYRILRAPGYYCCHCQKAVIDAPTAKLHVEAQHPGVASPDPANPAGYRRDNFYACEREE
jgi:hypothetical protein